MAKAIIKCCIGKAVSNAGACRDDSMLDSKMGFVAFIKVDQGPIPAPECAIVEFQMSQLLGRGIIYQG